MPGADDDHLLWIAAAGAEPMAGDVHDGGGRWRGVRGGLLVEGRFESFEGLVHGPILPGVCP